MQEKLTQLRQAVAQAQSDLFEAEADLVDQRAEINAFEFIFEARVGHLLDQLADLDKEIHRYQELIETLRNREVFGNAYLSVEKQYERVWQKPDSTAPTPPPQPINPTTEAEIKQLYRQLACRFHPDLAKTDDERAYRTDKMTAINNAYAARSIAELQALAQTPDFGIGIPIEQTEAQMIQALRVELSRCRQRLADIEAEIRSFKHLPSVQLSLEVKISHGRGIDLLGQMKRDLEEKLAKKSAERDMLKAQVDELGPDQGFIPIPRG